MDNEREEVVQLYLDDIIPNRFQPREVFDDQALKELAVSIREHGVIQPILVRKFGEKYEIIAGERRYKASTMAGLTKIPAIIKNLDDKESSKVALIENLQRRDLTPIEEARTYQKILDLDTMTQDQLAKTMGKSQSSVSNKLRLLTLPDEIQEALLNNKISERHARSLLNVSDNNSQISLLKDIISNKMTVRELDQKIKDLNNSGSSDDSTNGGNAVVNNNIGVNNMNYNDPTSVDVDKIREQAADINTLNNEVTTTSEPQIDLMGNSTISNNSNLFNNNVVQESNNIDNSNVLNGDEVLGNGLLAGNPVLSSNAISSSVNGANDQLLNSVNTVPSINNNQLFGTASNVSNVPNNNLNVVNDTPVNLDMNSNSVVNSTNNLTSTPNEIPISIDNNMTQNISADSNSLFNSTPAANVVDVNNSINNSLSMDAPVTLTDGVESLFSTPAPEQIPVENKTGTNNLEDLPSDNKYKIKLDYDDLEKNSKPIGDAINNVKSMIEKGLPVSNLFDNNNSTVSAAVQSQPVVSTLSVESGTEQIKNLVQSLKSQGYNVTIEEINIDNEVQLIVKFIRG